MMAEVVRDGLMEPPKLKSDGWAHESKYGSGLNQSQPSTAVPEFPALPRYHPVVDLRGDEIVRVLQPTPAAEAQRLKVFNYISSIIKSVLDVDVRLEISSI